MHKKLLAWKTLLIVFFVVKLIEWFFQPGFAKNRVHLHIVGLKLLDMHLGFDANYLFLKKNYWCQLSSIWIGAEM